VQTASIESFRVWNMRTFMKFASVAVMVLVVIAALGPESWQPRTSLGWQIDHFLGYFVITVLFCFGWPRPFVVGAALMAGAVLLETLQTLTQDRSSNPVAALCSAGGVLAAALLAQVFMGIITNKLGKAGPGAV
jgi:hypothetical protein